MSWWTNNSKKLSDSNKEIEEAFGGYGSQAHGGYETKACRNRNVGRNKAKRKQNTGEQILSEEEKAIKEAKSSPPVSSEDGQYIADKVVDKSFWSKLF